MDAFPELEREQSQNGQMPDRSSQLIRSALQRARKVDPRLISSVRKPSQRHDEEGRGPRGVCGQPKNKSRAQQGDTQAPAPKRARPEQVTLDVSGRLCHTRRDVLSAFGPSSFFDAELEDFHTEEPIVLGCSESAFEELHAALALARKDVQAGLRALRDSLAGRSREDLSELIDFLGLQWLHGTPLKSPPDLGGQEVLLIARLKHLTSTGVLRQLADRSLLPNGFGGPAASAAGERGMVSVARETAWACSLSKEQGIAQVLCLPSAPVSPESARGQRGYFRPNVLRDGDRLVFDVGQSRFVHVECLVLGLAAMEGKDEQVRIRLEASGDDGARPACEATGRVRHREHCVESDAHGGWTMAPQTCSVLQVKADGVGEPLVGRVFAAKCEVVGGGTLGLYHAELFGYLLEAPPEMRSSKEPAAPFAFDHRSTLHCSQSQDRFYPEELDFLRSFGLLDATMEQELDELGWDDYDQG
mmetsp:Transcript_15180/g.43382  ORF Transcript_15180/g.43382 Transcript_15180/m.43382 type:complete len:473 (-) Transcript_15180:40-1458(-)